MRLSLAAASLAVSVALLAGCSSSSQGTSSLPGSGSGSSQPMSHQGKGNPFNPAGIKGKIDPMKLVKLQVAGKLPAPAVHKVMQNILKTLETKSRPNLKFHRNVSVGAWALNNDYSYMLGLKKNLKKTVTAVNTESNGCYYPVTVKADSASNAWVGCEYNSDFAGAQAQEYNSSGTVTNTYSWSASCPPSTYCYEAFGIGFDQGESTTTVVDGNTESFVYYCEETYPYSCFEDEGAGFFTWPRGNPSATPTEINLYGVTDSGNNVIYEVGYLDVDPSGNVYFTYDGCENAYPYDCGFGLDQVSDTGGTPTALIYPGGIEFWGGVYVSNSGAALNVIDQELRTSTQYVLPYTGATNFTLGPTATNIFGSGDPIQGTFNSAGAAFAAGDAYGWIDKVTVSGDTSKAIANINCSDGCFGTTFKPSDRTW